MVGATHRAAREGTLNLPSGSGKSHTHKYGYLATFSLRGGNCAQRRVWCIIRSTTAAGRI